MDEKTQIQQALALLSQDPLKQTVLTSCIAGGMTNSQKIEILFKKEKVSSRSVRRKLNWLAAPPVQHGFLPLLEMIEIAPEGSNGRPAKSYWLTEFGAAVLTALAPDHPVTAPSFRNQADLTHRYITLKVAEQAEKSGLSPLVEHTLRNPAQEVRADLYMLLDDMLLIVEVEQKLLRQNFKRAPEKLLRLARFIQAEKRKEEWQVQLVFNIHPREEPTLVRYWQEAFQQAQKEFGELPYDLYYINARDLLETPSFLNALNEAELFTENYLHAKKTDKLEEARPDYITEDIYLTFQDTLDDLLEAPPEESLRALTEFAGVIHAVSYYENSPSMKAAVFPWASIWLMRRYLEDPRMATVKAELANTLTRIQKRSPGMVMLRETVTSLLWDVLLFHHGLGRGGVLQVVFQVPDFQDRSSDFRVEVRIDTDLRAAQTEDVKALNWFFTSIYLYRQHLDLIENAKK